MCTGSQVKREASLVVLIMLVWVVLELNVL